MARIRTIKPEFWKHEDLSELPPETHMLAAALLNYADDEGYFNANAKLIQAECCPLRDDSTNVRRSIEMLSSIGYIRLFEGSDGKSYGHIKTFSDHQRVDRPKPSKIKALEVSQKDRRRIDDESTLEGKGKEQGTGKGSTHSSDPDGQTRKYTDDDLLCAEFVLTGVMQAAPKTKKPNLEKWADQVRLMREVDGLTHREICEVFTWANKNSFWSTNILSVPKLREKFAVLSAKRTSENENRNQHTRPARLSPSDAAWQQYVEGGEPGDDYISAEFAQVDETAEPDRSQGFQSLGIGYVGPDRH